MRLKQSLSLLVCIFLACTTFATHLRCGQISVRQITPGRTTVIVTIEVFLNTVHTNVLFGGEDDWLDFGDGSRMLVPEQELTRRFDLQPDGSVAYAAFSVEHSYQALGSYTVSYSEPNRNARIVNFDNSVSTRFYVETKFLLMTDMAYQTPVPLLPPIFYGFANDNFSASVAAVDSNNFALRYLPRVPLMDRNTRVENYRQSESTFIDPLTGLISWDCKFNGESVLGEFLFGVQIDQFDTREEPWKNVGHVYRDFQIIVSDDSGLKGSIADNVTTEQNVIEVPESETASLKVFVYPGDGDYVNLTLKTELTADSYSFTVYDSAHDQGNIVVAKVELTHAPSVARNLPYIISIRTSFTNVENDRYFKDVNFAFITKEFVPAFGPINGINSSEETFSLVPNPFRDFVWLRGAPSMPLSLAVHNSFGQLVLTTQTDPEGRIDLLQLPSGIYFIKSVSPEGRFFAAKMMKQ